MGAPKGDEFGSFDCITGYGRDKPGGSPVFMNAIINRAAYDVWMR